MAKNVIKERRSIVFRGETITDLIVFDADPGQILKETIRYEEMICVYNGKTYLRIYEDNEKFTNYRYTFVPLKHTSDHKNVDRQKLPKPYFTIETGGMKVYE